MTFELPRYSHSLSTQLDCMKKIFYYLNKDDKTTGAAASYGINLHTHCENYLKTKEVPGFEDSREYEAFYKIKPYLDQIANKIQDVELYAEKPINEDFMAHGRLDAILTDGTILDWKFPTKKWTHEKFITYVKNQGWLYLWLFNSKKLIYVVVTDDCFAPQMWPLEYDEKIIQEGLGQARLDLRKIKAAIDLNNFPASPSTWRCRYCNYKEICDDKI